MPIFILNKISQLVPKAQNRVGSPFEFVHNARKRGKALLHSLVELLVS
jgi:hypothetical protein